ncbi:unnamed protein product [Rhizoctonia solani]|uniref:Uncharacterized protein n=1 Tax=Rhizoctonia solani TaxID=456999 RepID=A0A8H3C0Z4_9AGAM|nr:unnamed protein product [Rhizoctonia solani]
MERLPYFAAGYEFGAEEFVAAAKALGYERVNPKNPLHIGWSCVKISLHLRCDIVMLQGDPDDTWSYFIFTRGSRQRSGFPWAEHEKDREVKVLAQALGIKCKEFKNLDHPKIL